MPESHLTSKGQITLPKVIRDHLKVKSGDVVSFAVESDGRVIVSAVTAPVTSLKGMITGPSQPVTLEAMQQAVRQASRDPIKGVEVRFEEVDAVRLAVADFRDGNADFSDNLISRVNATHGCQGASFFSPQVT